MKKYSIFFHVPLSPSFEFKRCRSLKKNSLRGLSLFSHRFCFTNMIKHTKNKKENNRYVSAFRCNIVLLIFECWLNWEFSRQTHIIALKCMCGASLKTCSTLYLCTANTHTHTGAHRIISLGKQLHSHPTGKGSYSVGGLEAISITNRKLGARTENQTEMRMNLRNQSREGMLTLSSCVRLTERDHIFILLRQLLSHETAEVQ